MRTPFNRALNVLFVHSIIENRQTESALDESLIDAHQLNHAVRALADALQANVSINIQTHTRMLFLTQTFVPRMTGDELL